MNGEEILKEVAVEATKELAKDVYADAVQPTTRNVGGFFGTLSGFFNHVVMYPLKKLNTEYEQKAIAFEREMEKKYNNIPDQNKTEPQLHIVGPTMESLKYNILDNTLAELFSNLLVSNMDKSTQGLCTPAFVQAIEQLSPNDAQVFKSLYLTCKNGNALPICEMKIVETNDKTRRIRTELIPKYVTDTAHFTVNEHDISKSIQNLERLGLIELNFLKSFTDKSIYENLKSQNYLIFALNMVDQLTGVQHVIDVSSRGIIVINDFGIDFAKVCMRN